MSEQWCKCRIVEPRIFQQDDTLICLYCHERKQLPPKVDFAWEREKKKFTEQGKIEYSTYSKDALIEMLLNRDRQLLDDYKNHKNYSFTTPKELQNRIIKFIPYLTFGKES